MNKFRESLGEIEVGDEESFERITDLVKQNVEYALVSIDGNMFKDDIERLKKMKKAISILIANTEALELKTKEILNQVIGDDFEFEDQFGTKKKARKVFNKSKSIDYDELPEEDLLLTLTLKRLPYEKRKLIDEFIKKESLDLYAMYNMDNLVTLLPNNHPAIKEKLTPSIKITKC
jgi:hypothetical protein